MSIVVTPLVYGTIPYGIASYGSYFSSGIPVSSTSQLLVLESLVNELLPAHVKVYYVVQ